MDKLARVKSEIERREKENKHLEHLNEYVAGRLYELRSLLSFIDSMQESQVKESGKVEHEQKTCKGIDDSLTREVVSEDKLAGLSNAFLLALFDEEPVSEDLEEASYYFACKCHPLKTEYSTSSPNPEVIEAFKAGAQWQKKKEYTCYEEAFEDGASWKKEEMMKDATKTIVAVDAGGYPYIPQIELYDYDKDIPLAKEGDKYKVVLIKEE